MLTNTTLIWIQSKDPKNGDYLYKDGVLVDKDNVDHAELLRTAITIDSKYHCVYDKDGLSIYRNKLNSRNVIINSTFDEVDYVERHIAFIANVYALSQDEIVNMLDSAITSCGYSLSKDKMQIISGVTRKKKVNLILVALVIISTLAVFAICFKMCS